MAKHFDSDITWALQTFSELDPDRLYEIIKARVDVFVVEQACPYPELDGRDQDALHLSGCTADGELAAYARILAPGEVYAEAAIGRVLTVARFRGCGLGRPLMQRAIAACGELYPGHGIRLGAQYRLQQFYVSLGFVAVGSPYDEDGIRHIEMVRAADGTPSTVGSPCSAQPGR